MDQGFPASFFAQLGPFLAQGGGLSLSASKASQHLALSILTIVLEAVAKRGGQSSSGDWTGSPDERTASMLLAMACSLAISPQSGPRQVEGASRLSAIAATCAKAPVQLQIARIVLALRAACFHVGDASA